MSFAFSFSGDDIDDDDDTNINNKDTTNNHLNQSHNQTHNHNRNVAPPSILGRPTEPATAFPIQGKPQLPPVAHELEAMLRFLPSRIAYDTLAVRQDSNNTPADNGTPTAPDIILPRRELWDVRMQLMAEDDQDDQDDQDENDRDRLGAAEGLGPRDVKTGVYEGGFKSWESSVDLVKVLLARGVGLVRPSADRKSMTVIELGCGTALPSLTVFSLAMTLPPDERCPLTLVLADYNPAVLRLVTLPNIILVWALARRRSPHLADAILTDALSADDELELTPPVLAAFIADLADARLRLLFYSGGWGPEFVDLLRTGVDLDRYGGSGGSGSTPPSDLLLLGSETIYSPFALQTFTDTLLRLLRCGEPHRSRALVAAKRLYFGVGGSLDDFVELARKEGLKVTTLREETEGVRRGVVQCEFTAGA